MCGAPSAVSVCEICRDRIFFPARSLIISEYTGVMKNIIRAVKFKAGVRPVKYLAEKGQSFLLKNEVFPDLITCVPMNRKKRKKRGYNQAELIARALADLTGIRFLMLLNENENTVSQKKLSFEERFINVLGRYYPVRPGRCTGKKILIVDDVFTTGATLNECSRLLLEAGASEITTLTFARADIKGLKIEGAVIL